MLTTSRIGWEILRSIDSATFTGSFQPVGGPLLFPSYICKMVNNSTSLVLISINGVDPVDVLPPNSFWLYDEGKVGTNSQFPALPKGTQIFVEGAAGTGSVYLVSQYLIQG